MPLGKLLITLMRDRFDRLEVLAQTEKPCRVAACKVTSLFMDTARQKRHPDFDENA